MFKEDVDPEGYVEEHGLKVVNDTDALTKTIEELLAEEPAVCCRFQGRKRESHGLYCRSDHACHEGQGRPGCGKSAGKRTHVPVKKTVFTQMSLQGNQRQK